jgi:hypothetical protein
MRSPAGGAEEPCGEDGSEAGMLSRVRVCRCSVTFSLIRAHQFLQLALEATD